jgi:signal peptidase I
VRPPLEQDSPFESTVAGTRARAPRSPTGASFLKELPVLVLIAFGLALGIKTFLVQAFYIPSESMVPTLEVGDRVLVNKLVYRFRDPRRGEVVVFVAEHDQAAARRGLLRRILDELTEGLGVTRPADRDFIKRIIGLPGETIEVRDGVVHITTVEGKRLTLDEPYLADQKDLTPFGPTVVPPRSYFVMGDNRPDSADSRSSLGPVRRSDIVGKAFVRVWPLGRLGLLRTPSYPGGAALLALPGVAGIRRRRALSSGRWSRMARSSASSTRRDSTSWPAATRRGAGRSPGPWWPRPSSCPATSTSPASRIRSSSRRRRASGSRSPSGGRRSPSRWPGSARERSTLVVSAGRTSARSARPSPASGRVRTTP